MKRLLLATGALLIPSMAAEMLIAFAALTFLIVAAALLAHHQ